MKVISQYRLIDSSVAVGANHRYDITNVDLSTVIKLNFLSINFQSVNTAADRQLALEYRSGLTELHQQAAEVVQPLNVTRRYDFVINGVQQLAFDVSNTIQQRLPDIDLQPGVTLRIRDLNAQDATDTFTIVAIGTQEPL